MGPGGYCPQNNEQFHATAPASNLVTPSAVPLPERRERRVSGEPSGAQSAVQVYPGKSTLHPERARPRKDAGREGPAETPHGGNHRPDNAVQAAKCLLSTLSGVPDIHGQGQ